MTLELTGRADPRTWVDQIRERLYLADGRPVNQRPHDDPKGSYSHIGRRPRPARAAQIRISIRIDRERTFDRAKRPPGGSNRTIPGNGTL